MKTYSLLILFFALNVSAAEPFDLKQLSVQKPYTIEYFATDVKNARSLARGDKGTIFLGTREGEVYALVDENKDHRADKKYVIAKDLNMPNGVAFRNGSLYVAEIHRILRFDKIESQLANPPKPVVVYDKLPTDRHHGWKFIAFGPDDQLYVPIGAPCNICEPNEPYAAILRFKVEKDGGLNQKPELFARGIRNTVGFTWHPTTQAMWFTDNGRDMMGDDLPADELNVANKKGLDFGYPYCHQGDTADPNFGKKKSCDQFVKPIQNLGAHVAALGLRFWKKDLLIIAEHGSWNRSQPIGYRLMAVQLKNNKVASYKVFAEGWLTKDNKVLGRPVDVLVMPDGALLVSDDHAGAVYRIK